MSTSTPTYSPLTDSDIESIDVGTVIEYTYDTRYTVPLPGARWHQRTVCEITYRGTSDKGNRYVGGYHPCGNNGAKMSFSCHAGESHIQVVRPAAVPTVMDVLGREYTVDRTYSDGSYNCPCCHAAVQASQVANGCPNPTCVANPRMPVRLAQEAVDRKAARVADETRRKQQHASAMARIAEDKQRAQRQRQELLAEAQEKGYCPVCILSYHRKHIRHRKPENCPKPSAWLVWV